MRKLIFIVLILLSVSGGCFSAGKGRIAYVKDGLIYVCDQDGQHPRSVTPAKGAYTSLRWSPDGRWVACLQRNGEMAIPKVFSAQTSKSMVLKSTAYRTCIPSWSSDSRQVVFACDDKPGLDELSVTAVYTFNVLTNRLKKVTSGHPYAAGFLSNDDIVYVDNTSCRAYYCSSWTGKVTENVKLNPGTFHAWDFTTVEVIPFGRSILCRNQTEKGLFVDAELVSRSESWYSRSVSSLDRELKSAGMKLFDCLPAVKGRSAYILYNNQEALRFARPVPGKGRSRVYLSTRRGNKLIFKDEGAYVITGVCPLSGDRLLFETRAVGEDFQESSGLRIYDPSSGKMTLLTSNASDPAVWPGL